MFIVLIIGAFWIPIRGRKWLIRKDVAALKAFKPDEYSKESVEMLNKLNRVIRNKTIGFWIGIVIFYVPIALPTVLFIIDKILGTIA